MMAKLQAQVLVRKLQGLIDAAFARRARGPAAHALRTALPPHGITRRCGTDALNVFSKRYSSAPLNQATSDLVPTTAQSSPIENILTFLLS